MCSQTQGLTLTESNPSVPLGLFQEAVELGHFADCSRRPTLRGYQPLNLVS